MASKDGDVDRISELPEAILHNILHFLPMKQIIQLSILSKTWKRVSITNLNFKFNQDLFGEYYLWGCPFEIDMKRSECQESLNVVNHILNHFRDHSLSIHEQKCRMSFLRLYFQGRYSMFGFDY
ncbi:hypothetical protein ACFE04_000603 [Oxalis oulophora]